MTGPGRGLARASLLWMVACAKSGAPEAPERVAVEAEAEEPEAEVVAAQPEARPTASDGYLAAHADLQAPLRRAGGPVQVDLTQSAGGVYVIRPDKKATGLAAAFSDKFFTMYNAKLDATLVDVTATDAAISEDTATLTASWQDSGGNVYEVRCCSALMTQGVDHPTFGGVVTNHLLHGFTGVGMEAMPTTFAWAAMWGLGEVRRNGEVLDEGVPVHLMVTENVRDADFQMVGDAGVNPTERQLELIVAPMRVQDGRMVPSPVSTGYTFKGEEMPFWHVVFPHYRMNVTEPQA